MIGRIAMGTAQFGLDYGITNKRGRIPLEECRAILKKAFHDGIDLLDTAFMYGESESVIGEIISEENLDFRIVSKFPSLPSTQLSSTLDKSLQRLKRSRLYGYMVHDFGTLSGHPALWEVLTNLKSRGLVQKIGVSFYFPHELEALLLQGKIPDLVQVPYNIMDRRFEGFFDKLKQLGVEIHTRSVFLQGLLLQRPEELGTQFSTIKEKIIGLNDIAKRREVPLAGLLLDFVLSAPQIDKVVVGVDGVSNYDENLKSITVIQGVGSAHGDLADFEVTDERIILPSNWK